jgi:hypothetical protein
MVNRYLNAMHCLNRIPREGASEACNIANDRAAGQQTFQECDSDLLEIVFFGSRR